MVYDSSYDYRLINEYEFDSKYLLALSDGSKYSLLNDGIEEIKSSCINEDSLFEYKVYYKIKSNFCFIKYKYNDGVDFVEDDNDNEKVKEMLENL